MYATSENTAVDTLYTGGNAVWFYEPTSFGPNIQHRNFQNPGSPPGTMFDILVTGLYLISFNLNIRDLPGSGQMMGAYVEYVDPAGGVYGKFRNQITCGALPCQLVGTSVVRAEAGSTLCIRVLYPCVLYGNSMTTCISILQLTSE